MNWLIRHRLSVRFSDCDPLGHVNNAVYLSYLEQARLWLWREQIGFMRDARADGMRGEAFILARAEVDFRAQARYADDLEVRIALGAFGRTSLTYDYEIRGVADDRLIAAAKTVQVWFDYDTQKPAPISDALKQKLKVPIG